MQAELIKQHIAQFDEDSVQLHINVRDRGYTVGGATVDCVCMHVGTADAGDGDYDDGDLAVCWDSVGDDANTAVMQSFYWEHAFDEQLRDILRAAGFSDSAANTVCGSEWGMQDDERASYDAAEIAAEVRAALTA